MLQIQVAQYSLDQLKTELERAIEEYQLEDGKPAEIKLFSDPHNLDYVNALNYGNYFIENPNMCGLLKMPEPNVMEQVMDPRLGITTNLILFTFEINGKDIKIPVSSISTVKEI